MKEEKNRYSELRFDLVSRDWVIISPNRAKRPKAIKKKEEIKETDTVNCPFCNVHNQEEPKLILRDKKEIDNFSNWTTCVIPNKYPALIPDLELEEDIEGGIYEKMNAVGFHELVITSDHKKHMADFSVEKVEEVFLAYKKRYLSLMKKRHVNHISIFHNHGERAGASISHPHSQIITTPLIDVDLLGSLSNAKRHYNKTGECIYCKMIKWDRKDKKRVVFENKDFIAVCPFASKHAFQVIISPKKHKPYFENITERELKEFSIIFSTVMKKIKKGLGEVDYNFYMHNSPCDKKDHKYYHYHWTIIPRSAVYAGFEIGTKMEISVMRPEDSAQFLREQKV